jgi:hypothetical protein
MLAGVSRIIWSGHNKSLLYLIGSEGGSELWEQPVAGGSPKRLRTFKGLQVDWIALSKDGNRFAVRVGTDINDFILFQRNRQ